MKTFQLDLLSLLAGMGAMAPTPPSAQEIVVTEEVLDAVMKAITDLVNGDLDYANALKEAIAKAGGEPTEAKVRELLDQTIKQAEANLRASIFNRRSTLWGISSEVLSSIVKSQVSTFLSVNKNGEFTPVLSTALAGIREMAKMLPRENEVLEKVGYYILKGMNPKEVMEDLAEVVRKYHELDVLKKNRNMILSMCKTLILEGRVKRYELGMISEALLGLEEPELNRERLQNLFESFAKDLAKPELGEVKNPWMEVKDGER
jgi:hypothetical protein